MLSAAELSRYARQLALPEVGLAGQERLRRARVLVVGAGGLGSPAALYLAAAGVGQLSIVDDDVVEVSNLHRQILHDTRDIGSPKSESARDALARLNPHIVVTIHADRLTSANAARLIDGHDIVVDGSDNYGTRYAVNDACAAAGIPWVYGSVERFAGQLSVFGAPDGPCYRCIFPEAPAPGSSPNCEEVGVIGAVPGVIGSLQALEALKWLLQLGDPLSGRLLQWDFLHGAVQEVALERRADCPACGAGAGSQERTQAPTIDPHAGPLEIEPAELSARMRESEVALLDIRQPWEWEVGVIGAPRLLAMEQLPEELASLDRATEIIVYCHHGVRSRMAAEWMRTQGHRARSLAGGTDRWSREIDPSLPRY